MTYYQAEMEAIWFADYAHTLKEWAEFGYNRVDYNGKSYWDGLEDGNIKSEELEGEEELRLDYWELDEDGYRVVILKKAD